MQIIGHSALAALLWRKAQTVDLTDPPSMQSFYMFIFKASGSTLVLQFWIISKQVLYYLLTFWWLVILSNLQLYYAEFFLMHFVRWEWEKISHSSQEFLFLFSALLFKPPCMEWGEFVNQIKKFESMTKVVLIFVGESYGCTQPLDPRGSHWIHSTTWIQRLDVSPLHHIHFCNNRNNLLSCLRWKMTWMMDTWHAVKVDKWSRNTAYNSDTVFFSFLKVTSME